MILDIVRVCVYPTLTQISRFQGVAEKFLSGTNPLAKMWQQLFGHMASVEWFINHHRLKMRLLQWQLTPMHWLVCWSTCNHFKKYSRNMIFLCSTL